MEFFPQVPASFKLPPPPIPKPQPFSMPPRLPYPPSLLIGSMKLLVHVTSDAGGSFIFITFRTGGSARVSLASLYTWYDTFSSRPFFFL